jgi:uncharacterized protein
MLTIIVKGTNGCNLACSYCSLGEKTNFQYIDEDGLKNLFMFSCQFAKYSNEKEINFIFHGGEPMLIRPDIYGESIRFAKMKFPELNIKFSMQSNGFVLTDSFVEIIKKHDIHMGISIDGCEKIQDSQRRTVANQPTYTTVKKNIDKLLRAGVSVSCLMVLTKNALLVGYDYLRFFEERGLCLKINPLLNYGEASGHPELILETGDYADYLIGLYEFIMEQNMDVIVSPIDDILESVVYDRDIRECTFRKECNRDFLCIDYKGDIYPCGKFSDMELMKIGNISKTAFKEIGDFLRENLCERRKSHLPEQCKSCKYKKLCNGGCSAEAVISGDLEEVPFMCKDYRRIFDYFHGEGLGLLKDELMKQKRKLEALV